MEIIMTCDSIPGTEASRIDLANKIVPQDRLIEATHAFIAKIASRSPTAVRITKKIALGASMQGFGNMFICEPELMQGITPTGETEEGIKAWGFLPIGGPLLIRVLGLPHLHWFVPRHDDFSQAAAGRVHRFSTRSSVRQAQRCGPANAHFEGCFGGPGESKGTRRGLGPAL